MTCIVGLLTDDRIYMGGDSAGVAGYAMSNRRDPKVFIRQGVLIGFTSSFRMGQLLRHKLHVPDQGVKQNTEEFLVTSFVDAIRACLKTGGYAKKENEVEEAGSFLVGYKGGLYNIQSDYQVEELYDDFNATGSGADVALGAMYVSENSRRSPKRRIVDALRAAERFNAGVRAPFIVESIKREKA